MGIIEIEKAIAKLDRVVFETRELALLTGISTSAVIQTLSLLEKSGLIHKIRRGLWNDARKNLSPYDIVPHLLPNQTLYISFISALHLHGVISQIPQLITVATLAHSQIVRTKVGTYRLHQLSREFFGGFGWYHGDGSFLIATPEKALVDSIYISMRKGIKYASFPELALNGMSKKKAVQWAGRISNEHVRKKVIVKIEDIFEK